MKKAFLAIDVSKGYADFLLLDEQKQTMEEAFLLDDNSEGRKQLKQLIEKWFSLGIDQLYCAVESTGGYENNWLSFLKNLNASKPVRVARLNARAVKAVSDASLKRTITDAVSAHNIGLYMISFPEKIEYANEKDTRDDQFKDGRQHNSYVRMLQKQKTQLSNQLEKLLYQHFSEVLIYCRHGMPNWLLKMLSKYPTAQNVMKAGVSKLLSVKGISQAKAEALLKKVDQPTQIVSSQIRHVISATAMEILHKDHVLEQEKTYLTETYQDNDQVKLLTTIPCIGPESGVITILEIENIERFAVSKKLAAYFGVHPTFKQSGDGKWGSHMSKKGRGQIRAMLYMAALSGIKCNPILKPLYHRCRAKGMKHYQAMGVLMHKLLRIIYGVLKNQKPFDASIDKKNQERATEKQVELDDARKETEKYKNQKKHRYQSITTEAPISRTAERKRKKQIAS